MKKSTPPSYSIISFCPFSRAHIIYSHSISSPFYLSPLSFILIRSLLLFITLPYNLFFHSRKGRKALYQFELESSICLVKSVDPALGMRDREEKNPMATASEALSWNLKGREIHIRLGPRGHTTDTAWDDGCHQRIESIFVCYDSSYIGSIQTVYRDFNNNIFVAPQRGSQSSYSSIFEAVHPPPETLITRIDGYFNGVGITCLELSTNNGKICSFGTKTGSPFIYKDPRGFTGFHGRFDSVRLSALGVYVNSSATKS